MQHPLSQQLINPMITLNLLSLFFFFTHVLFRTEEYENLFTKKKKKKEMIIQCWVAIASSNIRILLSSSLM